MRPGSTSDPSVVTPRSQANNDLKKASRQQLVNPSCGGDVAKGGGRGDHKQDADASCTETDVGLFDGARRPLRSVRWL